MIGIWEHGLREKTVNLLGEKPSPKSKYVIPSNPWPDLELQAQGATLIGLAESSCEAWGMSKDLEAAQW